MKVLHTGSLDVMSGGPAKSTYLTLKGLINNNVDASILMYPPYNGGALIANDVGINFTKPVLNKRADYMPGLKKNIEKIGDIDLYHIQGLWQYFAHGVAKYARSHSKPYIITLRGMLYPDGLNHSPLIKKIALRLYQRKDLQSAACIQATCEEEMKIYRSLGFTNPVCIIPNPIEQEGVVDMPIPQKDKVIFGYLGRVHPRKRIERMIYAFAQYKDEFKDAEMVIIGTDVKEYEDFLKSEVERLKLDNVSFLGFLTGKAKNDAVDKLSYLVVPSDMENFGNIVPEALVRGVPVIASTGMPWEDLVEYNCGWWVPNDQETINKTMLEALHLTREKNIEMGYNGKKLMKEKFEINYLGAKMKSVYDWILGNAKKPDFIYLSK